MKTLSFMLLLGVLLLQAACTQEAAQSSTMRSYPVTIIKLLKQDFSREMALTGVVDLYREEDIGFEVDGRVTMVLDEGIEVRGPAFNERGEIVRQGDTIAAMEGTRYGSQVGALQARLDAARRELQSVDAQVTLARQTLARQKAIHAEGAGAQQAIDDARSAFDQATSQLAARRATIEDITRQLDAAKEDLGDAVLLAPFSGRVTRVHISEGAVVKAGAPVMTLTLMDPVRIQVEVSADDEREIETGDRVIIFPKDPLKKGQRVPVNAIVFEKNAVADAALRTFRIDMIARNQRRHVDQLHPELYGLPIVNDFLPVVREYQGEAGPLFVPASSILVENDETYVLRLPGVGFHAASNRSTVGKHLPEKIRIMLADEYVTVANWNFRSVSDAGNLTEGDFLILNPEPHFLEGIAGGRPQWLLRPRDLVPVQFSLASTTPGFYMPNRAITLVGDRQSVFIFKDGVARIQPVTVHDAYKGLRRIEGEGIEEGVQIIVGGVHYVSDGQPVVISETLQ